MMMMMMTMMWPSFKTTLKRNNVSTQSHLKQELNVSVSAPKATCHSLANAEIYQCF